MMISKDRINNLSLFDVFGKFGFRGGVKNKQAFDFNSLHNI